MQVGTASFGDPGLLARLPSELDALLEAQGIADVRELIGSLESARGPREGVDAANALGGTARS